MAYEKRLCILKQIKRGFSADGSELSGAVYAERLGETLTLTPRMVGLAPVTDGRYVLCVWVNGNTYFLDFNDRKEFIIEGAPSLKEGFSALLCFVRGEGEAVAYGRCGQAPIDYTFLLSECNRLPQKKRGVTKKEANASQVASSDGEDGKQGEKSVPVQPLPPTELPVPSPQVPTTPQVPLPEGGYQDEAIADSNYFWEGKDEGKGHADEGASTGGWEERDKEKDGESAVRHEEDELAQPFYKGGGLTYYRQVEERIKAAFARYPKDESLLTIFPRSEWVKTPQALLGVVYEDGLPRYLCVAVEKNGEPPNEMQGKCVFVPRSHFTEEGFYISFQDADTGALIVPKES